MKSNLKIGVPLFLVLFITMIASGNTAFGQSNSKWPISLSQGTTVTLKTPNSAISLEKVSAWSGKYSFTVYVDQSGSDYIVGGYSNWQDLGWPSQLLLYVNKAERKKEYTQVELDDANGNHVKLRF